MIAALIRAWADRLETTALPVDVIAAEARDLANQAELHETAQLEIATRPNGQADQGEQTAESATGDQATGQGDQGDQGDQ